jgi:hypothetical protein
MKTHQKIVMVFIVLALVIASIGLIGGFKPQHGAAAQVAFNQPGFFPGNDPNPWPPFSVHPPYVPNVGWNS